LIEDNLCRYPGIGASENDCEWTLTSHQRGTLAVTEETVGAAGVGGEPEISLAEPLEGFMG
jgi:hypothetical protein